MTEKAFHGVALLEGGCRRSSGLRRKLGVKASGTLPRGGWGRGLSRCASACRRPRILEVPDFRWFAWNPGRAVRELRRPARCLETRVHGRQINIASQARRTPPMQRTRQFPSPDEYSLFSTGSRFQTPLTLPHPFEPRNGPRLHTPPQLRPSRICLSLFAGRAARVKPLIHHLILQDRASPPAVRQNTRTEVHIQGMRGQHARMSCSSPALPPFHPPPSNTQPLTP